MCSQPRVDSRAVHCTTQVPEHHKWKWSTKCSACMLYLFSKKSCYRHGILMFRWRIHNMFVCAMIMQDRFIHSFISPVPVCLLAFKLSAWLPFTTDRVICSTAELTLLMLGWRILLHISTSSCGLLLILFPFFGMPVTCMTHTHTYYHSSTIVGVCFLVLILCSCHQRPDITVCA